MNYVIVSIDDSRLEKKTAIRQRLGNHTEIPFVGCNGRDPESVKDHMDYFSGHLDRWTPKVGELGVWLSMQKAWETAVNEGPLIVLEDDAVVAEEFDVYLNSIMEELPEDWDFFALFVPDNQFRDFWYTHAYDDRGEVVERSYKHPLYQPNTGSLVVAKSYQGYSCVGMMYSRAGGQKLLDIAKQYGMYTPVDCFIFQQAFAGKVNGYAHHPAYRRPVTYDWENSPTLVQDTEIYTR